MQDEKMHKRSDSDNTRVTPLAEFYIDLLVMLVDIAAMTDEVNDNALFTMIY